VGNFSLSRRPTSGRSNGSVSRSYANWMAPTDQNDLLARVWPNGGQEKHGGR
jgi:hypothetical protein